MNQERKKGVWLMILRWMQFTQRSMGTFFTIITANMNLAMAVCIPFLQGPLTGTLTLRVSCAHLAAADTIAETSKSETIAEVGWVVGGWMEVWWIWKQFSVFIMQWQLILPSRTTGQLGDVCFLPPWTSLPSRCDPHCTSSATSTPFVQNGL